METWAFRMCLLYEGHEEISRSVFMPEKANSIQRSHHILRSRRRTAAGVRESKVELCTGFRPGVCRFTLCFTRLLHSLATSDPRATTDVRLETALHFVRSVMAMVITSPSPLYHLLALDSYDTFPAFFLPSAVHVTLSLVSDLVPRTVKNQRTVKQVVSSTSSYPPPRSRDRSPSPRPFPHSFVKIALPSSHNPSLYDDPSTLSTATSRFIIKPSFEGSSIIWPRISSLN